MPATPAHAAALAAIHAAAFPPAEAWDGATLAAQLTLPGSFGLLETQGGMLLARVVAAEAEILTFAVAPAARRRGLGRALLTQAMAQAAAAVADKMFLEVAATNYPARALYHAAGFRRVGQRRDYYADGSDALVLCAALSPGGSPGG